MKKIVKNSALVILSISSISPIIANDKQQQAIAQMIKVKRCLAGVNKPEECAQCPSEQSILSQAVANGSTSTAFLEEVRHSARLSQQPAAVMDAITAQALTEKNNEDTMAILQKQENKQFYSNMIAGLVGVVGVAVGFGLRAVTGSSK